MLPRNPRHLESLLYSNTRLSDVFEDVSEHYRRCQWFLAAEGKMEAFGSLRSMVGLAPEPREKTWMEKLEAELTCSYTTRITGFVVLLLMGLVCCVLVRP